MKIQQSTISILFLFFLPLMACKKGGDSPTNWEGSGASLLEFRDKVVRIFYFVPSNIKSDTPLLFVFHGASRNALSLRNALVKQAESYEFILIVPEFSEEHFPDVNSYQLGNIFTDGENPSTASLNSEQDWTFEIMEPMLDLVQKKTSNSSGKSYLIGHSAGAQFLHRLLIFRANLEFEKALISAAGWYTIPSDSIDFPYGLNMVPNNSSHIKSIFEKDVIIQVGSLDNDPESSQLRRNDLADVQGENRLERAKYFYEQSQKKSTLLNASFAWELKINAGMNHNSENAFMRGIEHLFNRP